MINGDGHDAGSSSQISTGGWGLMFWEGGMRASTANSVCLNAYSTSCHGRSSIPPGLDVEEEQDVFPSAEG